MGKKNCESLGAVKPNGTTDPRRNQEPTRREDTHSGSSDSNGLGEKNRIMEGETRNPELQVVVDMIEKRD